MTNLRIESSGHRRTLVLDRPTKANALSAELVEELIAAVEAAAADGVRVLVLRGEGRNLSAGFDFGDIETQTDAGLVKRLVRVETLRRALVDSPCLTVAFAHGRNFGAGVDLFAACRVRVAAAAATFRMPGLAFGLVLGTRRFARLVGGDHARAILESLATFDAPKALAMGFVSRIAEPDTWEAAVAELAPATLPASSRAALYRALADSDREAEMAELVGSASVPGLRDRIKAYLAP